jgi:hypothetical protein
MSATRELAYTLALPDQRKGAEGEVADGTREGPQRTGSLAGSIPRIARLMALAIRFDALIRDGEAPDYAALARAGRVTRARMSQIMKLLGLAPDLQERILFLPESSSLNERKLRPIVRQIDWSEQRRLFRRLVDSGRE